MKNKVVKLVLLIFLVIVLVIIVYLVRNFYIINSLQNKLDLVSDKSNYHINQRTTQASSYMILDMYKTTEKSKLIEHRISLDDFSSIENITIFNDNVTTYTNFGESKSVNTNSTVQEIEINNPYKLYTKESESNILVELMKTYIKSTTYNGKDCYLISNSMFSNMYVDKENGLLLKIHNGTSTLENGEKYQVETTYYYEFDTVTEENVIEPNIEEYK